MLRRGREEQEERVGIGRAVPGKDHNVRDGLGKVGAPLS